MLAYPPNSGSMLGRYCSPLPVPCRSIVYDAGPTLISHRVCCILCAKNVAFNQCCFNVDPLSSTLAHWWNSIKCLYRVFWLLHYAGDALTSRRQEHQITRYIGHAGPPFATVGQHYSSQNTLSSLPQIYFFYDHLLMTKVPNLRTWNVILYMFIRTGIQKCEPFPTHSTLFSP